MLYNIMIVIRTISRMLSTYTKIIVMTIIIRCTIMNSYFIDTR